MDTFTVDTNALEDAAKRIGGQIAQLVAAAIAATPGAAATATAATSGFLTAQALTQLCVTELVTAVKQLVTDTSEHANLLQTTADVYRTRDEQLGVPFTEEKQRMGQ